MRPISLPKLSNWKTAEEIIAEQFKISETNYLTLLAKFTSSGWAVVQVICGPSDISGPCLMFKDDLDPRVPKEVLMPIFPHVLER